MTIYKQVPIEEELPPNNNWVFLKTKDHDEMLAKYCYGQWRLFYKEGELEIMETDEILFWLKETNLPTEEEIRKYAIENTNFSQEQDGFIYGAEYILNLLKSQK